MATLNEVSKEILLKIDDFSDSVIREVALDYVTRSKKRIFTDGLKRDGTPIGEYSEATKGIKRKKGRFTSDKVNLRDTETLVNSYVAEPKGDSYEVGFVNATRNGVSNTEKIVKLRVKYGEDIFVYAQQELDNIDILINKLTLF